MAADTSKSPAVADAPVSTGKPELRQWNFNQQPDDEVTAGRAPVNHAAQPTVGEAWKTVKAEDIWNLPTRPCVREGFLAAILGGLGVGSGRWFFGAPIPKAANWAVGGFIISSVVAYETCNAKRRAEKIRMARAVEIYEQSKLEKARKQEQLERIKLAAELAEAEKMKAEKKWFNFW